MRTISRCSACRAFFIENGCVYPVNLKYYEAARVDGETILLPRVQLLGDVCGMAEPAFTGRLRKMLTGERQDSVKHYFDMDRYFNKMMLETERDADWTNPPFAERLELARAEIN